MKPPRCGPIGIADEKRPQLFVAWVVVSFIWLWVTLCIANFYPLVDGGFQKIWQVVNRRQPAEGPPSGESTGTSTPSTDGPAAGDKALGEVVVDEKHSGV